MTPGQAWFALALLGLCYAAMLGVSPETLREAARLCAIGSGLGLLLAVANAVS